MCKKGPPLHSFKNAEIKLFETVDLDVHSAWINVDMSSTATCENYFRWPPCSCEALINLKACFKEANLPSLATVPIYCPVILFLILSCRAFEKKVTKKQGKRKQLG